LPPRSFRRYAITMMMVADARRVTMLPIRYAICLLRASDIRRAQRARLLWIAMKSGMRAAEL